MTVTLEGCGTRGGRAFLRTTIGRARMSRQETVDRVEKHILVLARGWHDIPMQRTGAGRFQAVVPLLETGVFAAKALFLGEDSCRPEWPAGDDLVVKVSPEDTYCRNTIYTAFPRQFNQTRAGATRPGAGTAEQIRELDRNGYSVIPPSGTFRDLIGQLDLIIGELGFRIIQLLPVHPTPTTFARMGRYGSPYAATDFFSVDPAMAEFDPGATPLDQFVELADAVHAREGLLFIDLPANHTGWASQLQVHHPDWFKHGPDGAFVSPGAWGVTWEDLC